MPTARSEGASEELCENPEVESSNYYTRRTCGIRLRRQSAKLMTMPRIWIHLKGHWDVEEMANQVVDVLLRMIAEKHRTDGPGILHTLSSLCDLRSIMYHVGGIRSYCIELEPLHKKLCRVS